MHCFCLELAFVHGSLERCDHCLYVQLIDFQKRYCFGIMYKILIYKMYVIFPLELCVVKYDCIQNVFYRCFFKLHGAYDGTQSKGEQFTHLSSRSRRRGFYSVFVERNPGNPSIWLDSWSSSSPRVHRRAQITSLLLLLSDESENKVRMA